MPTRTSSPFRKENADWIHDLQSPLAALRSIRSGEASPETFALIRGAIDSLERIVAGMKGSPSPSEEVVASAVESTEEFASIDVPRGAVIAILDDDPSIHVAWKKRFAEMPEGSVDRIIEAANPREMRLAMREFPDLFLMDHDLAGDDLSGLDLIIELGIARQAWLVTGRALDPGIRARCARHGVRILSKGRLAEVVLRICTDS